MSEAYIKLGDSNAYLDNDDVSNSNYSYALSCIKKAKFLHPDSVSEDLLSEIFDIATTGIEEDK